MKNTNKLILIGFLIETNEILPLINELPFSTNTAAYEAIESGSKAALKASFIKAALLYKGISFDYNEFFKGFSTKGVISQTGLLLMDLVFYKEITKNILKETLFPFKKITLASLKGFFDRQKRNSSLVYDLFLCRILYYQDIIENLQGKSLYDFEYLVQPKFGVECKGNPIENVDYEESLEEIYMISLNYKLKYEWEVSQIEPSFVFTPSIPRIFFNFIMTINLNKGIFLKPPQEISFKTLGSLLARPFLSLDPISLEMPLEMISQGLSAGFWLLLQIATPEFDFLSQIALQLNEIPQKQQVLAVLIKDLEPNNIPFAIKEIPRSFTEQFRPIMIKEWHLVKIVETRLIILGFSMEKAKENAKKLMLLYHILNNSFENQYFLMKNSPNIKDFLDNKGNLLGNSLFNEEILLKAIDGVNIGDISIESQIKRAIKGLLKGKVKGNVLKPLLSFVFGTEIPLKEKSPLQKNLLYCLEGYLKRKNREIVKKPVFTALQRIYECFEQNKAFIIAGRTNIGKSRLLRMTISLYNETQGIFSIKALFLKYFLY